MPHPAWQFCHDWLNGQQVFEQQTSGSTGKPKQIAIRREQMEASAKATIEALGLQEGNRLLVCLNPNYIGGKMMLVRGLVGNMNLVVVEPSGNPLEELPSHSNHFDFTALVPLQMEQILDGKPSNLTILNRMKGIIIGGAPVSPHLEAKIQMLKCPVYSTYGMTETVSHIALRRLNPPEDFYRVLPNTQVSQDARGCLTIQSAVTLQEAITTNDLVEILSPTTFRWLGRADFTINSGGIKIQPELLETQISAILSRLGISRTIAIVPQADDKLGQKVVLVIEGSEFDLEDLKIELKKEISRYEIPKNIVFFPIFPKTPNRKINRKELALRVGK